MNNRLRQAVAQRFYADMEKQEQAHKAEIKRDLAKRTDPESQQPTYDYDRGGRERWTKTKN